MPELMEFLPFLIPLASDFTKALAVTAVLCVGCVAGSVPLFHKKAL